MDATFIFNQQPTDYRPAIASIAQGHYYNSYNTIEGIDFSEFRQMIRDNKAWREEFGAPPTEEAFMQALEERIYRVETEDVR